MLMGAAKVAGGADPDALAIAASAFALYSFKAGDVTLNGSNVSQANDISGNARHGTQATAGNQMLWTASNANFSNEPTISAQDAGRYLALPDFSALSIVHCWLVLRVTVDPGVDGATVAHQLGSGANDHYPYADGVCYISCGTNVRKTAGNPSQILTSAHLMRVTSETNNWVCKINNTTLHTTATNTVGWPSSGANWLGHNSTAAPVEIAWGGWFPAFGGGAEDDLRDAIYTKFGITP
jgi:hypothetical protein